MKSLPLLLAGFAAASPAFAVKEFTEAKSRDARSAAYEQFQRKGSRSTKDDFLMGGLRANFKRFANRVRVPGLISSTSIPEIAQVIGPSTLNGSFRLGDTIYLRWSGSPGPREGDRYSTFTPAIVMQSLSEATDFQIRLKPRSLQEIPDEYRMAGYYYEGTGTVRVVRINQGIVEAVIERLSGQLNTGDQLMPMLPTKQDIKPVTGGIQLAAAVVCGSPADRLSTTERSFIYINRGSRDGIREGRVFQAIETVKLDGPAGGPAPERSLGEAMVVHVTDSYSTAMITKQFEVIRIGALLKTKQDLSPIPSGAPFADMIPRGPERVAPPEIPELGDVGAHQDPSLPDPTRRAPAPAAPALSELDSIERELKLEKLSPQEKARLGRLGRQEKLDAPADEEEEEAAPANSFGKPAEKKKKPKSHRKAADEEELNLLIQNN